MKRIVIIGSGGAARSILDTVNACNIIVPSYEMVGFIVDPEYAKPGTAVDDHPILGGFDWLRDHAPHVQAICGVGTPDQRANLVNRAAALGASFCTVIHPAAVFGRPPEVGEGTWIGPGTVVSHEVWIGRHVSISANCTIGHDVEIGDFVNLAPGVQVAGDVTLGEGAFLGIGSTIINKRRVGARSVVGAGTAVMRDVAPDTVVVGVPGRVIKRRSDDWRLD